jgi:hypothetical protein
MENQLQDATFLSLHIRRPIIIIPLLSIMDLSFFWNYSLCNPSTPHPWLDANMSYNPLRHFGKTLYNPKLRHTLPYKPV